MKRKIGLYVDDIRTPPNLNGVLWTIARTFHEAIYLLERTDYEIVSLDHDLGCFYGNREMTGDDVLNWLIARELDGLVSGPSEVLIHTANSAKSRPMKENADRFFNRKK